MRLLLPALIASSAVAAFGQSTEGDAISAPQRSAELFETTKVWPVHFTLTAEELAAMEPKRAQGQTGPFGGPGGPGGGPRGFGPGMIMAGVMLREGDADGDKRFSADEMGKLAGKWFTAWDADGKGKIDADAVKTGLN